MTTAIVGRMWAVARKHGIETDEARVARALAQSTRRPSGGTAASSRDDLMRVRGEAHRSSRT